MSVKAEHVSFSYGDHPVLQDVSFEAQKGQVLSILGPNGVGKSTLFRCILGLLPGYTGTITIDGLNARSLSIRETAAHIAYIPQSSSPVFRYSVHDIVLMGTTSHLRPFAAPRQQDLDKVQWALDKMGISHLAARCFHKISGGERQLALIARALVQDASILMLDEPTSSLDYGNQLLVLRQIRLLAKDGYTIIQTTHNPEQSYQVSDRILTLHGGRVFQEGTPQEVLTAGTIQALYGTEVEVLSLHEDQIRVCIPKER